MPPDRTANEHAGIRWKVLPELSATALAVPALLHGLRSFWSRDHRYGDDVLPLCKPWMANLLVLLGPLLRPFTRRRDFPAQLRNPQVMRSKVMRRDFEIFVRMPDDVVEGSPRRYPMLVAMDANGGFATTAETVDRLARAGEIDEMIVVGIGTPRAQGELEFGFRRFEELSPPVPAGHRYDDALGSFFRSVFALRGQEAQAQLGQAPGFHAFITGELLPRLLARLPVDAQDISLLGHSAAGTFVGYALAQTQSPFSGYVCLSPGVGIGNDWMLREAPASLAQHGKLPRIFVAIGAEEQHNPFNLIAGIPRASEYVALLREHGAPATDFHVLDGETHTTIYPRALAQSLLALHPARRVSLAVNQ
ncbi:MAG: alpha/beta hydrolase-fold protein, partial [Pseudomonadota bacterium]|nr:alpha/beta hydrolase-fold protein [Pseudomonadota bacterium]